MMPGADYLPHAIQWHEGMLLAPQHFQQMSFRHESLLYYHMSAALPWHWGIRSLKVDQARLIDGFFRIVELEAVLPDGLVVCHGSQDEELEIDLTPYDSRLKTSYVTIHLAVAGAKAGEGMVAGALPRYTSVEGIPVVDENSGESELSIPRLKPKLHLLAVDTPPQKYSAFPVARIGYRNETISMKRFIPPVLSIETGSPVGNLCASISRKLREKAVFLAEKIGGTGELSAGPALLETKFTIQSLVSVLPQFEAILNTGSSHPYHLYLSLCSLVGTLAILGKGMIPPVLPPYDHNDLLSSFEAAARFIFRVIDEGIQESHTPVAFKKVNGSFRLKLNPEWLDEKLIIGVRGKPDADGREVIEWIDECLIGSDSAMESMKAKRILGAGRKKIDSSGKLVPARGVTLFAVSPDPEFIEAGQTLRILNTSDPKAERCPLAVILYVVNR